VAEAGDHAEHDPLEVAAATDRGASLPALLRGCANCLDLHTDLALLSVAIPMAAIPRRPRDYRLTAADAARLRVGRWGRLLEAFGSALDEISRPLGIGFATLGVAGLLLTAIPSVIPMAGAGAAASQAPVMELAVPDGPMVPYGAPVTGPRDAKAIEGPATTDPLLLVSGAFLGAGAAVIVARAVTAGRRRVR
jgi:hypothetical protein